MHHASARRFRDLMTRAGLHAIAQKVYRGPAPFLLTEAVAAEPVSALPAPHFRVVPARQGQSQEATA